MWNDYESKEFTFCDRAATIVYPKAEANGRMLFKTEYLNAFPLFDIAMLDKGYHLINMRHHNSWGADEETQVMAEFVHHCAKELRTSDRCVVEGLSLGGLQGARFAQLYPALVAVLYLDAPVMNILSMAGLGRWRGDYMPTARQCIAEAYGLDESTLVNFRNSPIDHMDILLENNIPVVMVYGDSDEVVLYEENGRVLEDYYKEQGGILEVYAKPGCLHHPHGLENPESIVCFAEKYFNRR